MKVGACLLALTAALAAGALPARAADSPQCKAAKQRVVQIQNEITKLNKQLPNKDASINKVRQHQIAVRKAKLEKDLAAARTAVTKACGPDVSVYDGSYQGDFGRMKINFQVAKGVISGDIDNGPPLKPIDAKTGIGYARANFLGANCGTFAVAFDAVHRTATVANLKCSIGGLTETHTVVATAPPLK